MIATLTKERHIVLPPESEAGASLTAGQEYHVMISTSGVILLRPQKKPQRTLLEHTEAIRALGGIEMSPRHDSIPARVSL